MGSMIRALLLAAAALALGPPVAQAAPFGPAEETAYVEAQTYWQADPVLCSPLSRETVPEGSLGTNRAGWATRPLLAAGACNIQIVEGLSPGDLCLFMHHEYGHLLGLGHSADPNSIMYPNPALASVSRCLELEAQGQRRGLLEDRLAEQKRWCRQLKRERAAPHRVTHCWSWAGVLRERVEELPLAT